MSSKLDTPDELLPFSGALSAFVNSFDLAPERDVVVFCSDYSRPTWQTDPVAWFDVEKKHIAINTAKVYESLARKRVLDYSGAPSDEVFAGDFESVGDSDSAALRPVPGVLENAADILARAAASASPGRSKVPGATIASAHPKIRGALSAGDPDSDSAGDALAKTVLAMVLHETGHSVFTDFLAENWMQEMTGYERKVLLVLEELRIERQQLLRIGTGTQLLRYAADCVVSPRDIAQGLEMARGEDGEISIASTALNTTLCLGRVHYGLFHEAETADLRGFTARTIGEDRLATIAGVWERYSAVRETDPDEMRECVREWCEAVPEPESPAIKVVVLAVPWTGDGDESDGDESDGDSHGSAADSSVDGDSESAKTADGGESEQASAESAASDSVSEALSAAVVEAERAPEAGESDALEHKRSPSFSSYRKTTDSSQAKKSESSPTAEDNTLARKLSRDLERIEMGGRVRTVKPSYSPPGRLDARAAVRRAADAANGRGATSRAKPFERVTHVSRDKKQLVVGLAADVSGSHSWAQEFNARTAYIVGTAVHHVNGRFAAVTYGSRVTVVASPGERPSRVVTVAARDGTEEFDQACGTLDHLLKLRTGDGTRLLFVVGDGQMVKKYEMAKTAAWVRDLVSSGCGVVWISSSDDGDTCRGLPVLPPGATQLKIDEYAVSDDPTPAILRLADAVKSALRTTPAARR